MDRGGGNRRQWNRGKGPLNVQTGLGLCLPCEQIQDYTMEQVLGGTDGWNPGHIFS